MSIVWNITCECGEDTDYPTLAAAKKDARKHLGHDKDGMVYIDQVNTEMDEQGNYKTGLYKVIKK